MDTTGILIVAKNPFAHQQMAIQFENNTVEKKIPSISRRNSKKKKKKL